ncbi:MAG: hypothetical protein MUE50_14230 [Pirellulaceae bacterium]|jgi:hypothetical protein|nr:hypothetical protein [Pirellulaceae bacterium]
MSDSNQETVIVRDRAGLRQLRATDDWTTMTLLGALSADPREFDELARAWLRYEPGLPLGDLRWVECLGPPAPGPWLLLDLACLRIVAGGGAQLPENPAAFQRDEGPWNPEIPVVWINLPPDWQRVAATSWEQALPPLPVPSEPLDVRGVLFGRALAEGLARRTLDIARREPLPAERLSWDDLPLDAARTESQRATISRWHALTIRAHADWLLTPREDLGGRPPRDFLHSGRDWVDLELQNRQLQWSNQGRAPRPLDRNTLAYRYGPLGRHEVVMYFDLCREVIGAAWDRIVAAPQTDEGALTKVLYDHARRWLAEGSIDGDPTPPAAIIENERRRMPLVGDGSHLDCDCPICRMEAEGGFGPMFRGFDGHHLDLDDEFAFSLCATREEWEKQQEDYRRFSAEMDAKRREREAAGEDPFASVWTSSYVNEESLREAGANSPLAVMALAMRVGEVISDLEDAGGRRDLIELLNNAFDAYRTADGDAALSAVATTQLAEVLEQIASALPHLTAKAADLQSQIAERQRQAQSDFPF